MWERKSIPYALVAITNLHIGTTESVSDLVMNPIYRDALGFIKINGNALKGSVRSFLETNNNLACNQKVAMHIFGLGSNSSESRSGNIIFHDFFLLFLPFPHEELGLVYITSPAVLFESSKLFDMLALISQEGENRKGKSSNASSMKNNQNMYFVISSYLSDIAMRFLSDKESPKYHAWIYQKNKNSSSRIWLWDFYIPMKAVDALEFLFRLKNEIIKSVFENSSDPLIDLVINAPIIIIPDYLFRSLLLQGLDVTPHIKIEGFRVLDESIVYNKVTEFGPWFQEEIPKLSIFLGGITLSLRKRISDIPKERLSSVFQLCKELNINKQGVICEAKDLNELALILDRVLTIPNFIGGRKSTGLGLYQLANLSSLITDIINKNRGLITIKAQSDIYNLASYITEATNNMLKLEDFWELILRKLPKFFSSVGAKNKLFTLIDRIRRMGLLGLVAFYIMKFTPSQKKDETQSIILEIFEDVFRRILSNVDPEKKSSLGSYLKMLFSNMLCYGDKGYEFAEYFYDNYFLFVQVLNKLRRII